MVNLGGQTPFVTPQKLTARMGMGKMEIFAHQFFFHYQNSQNGHGQNINICTLDSFHYEQFAIHNFFTGMWSTQNWHCNIKSRYANNFVILLFPVECKYHRYIQNSGKAASHVVNREKYKNHSTHFLHDAKTTKISERPTSALGSTT